MKPRNHATLSLSWQSIVLLVIAALLCLGMGLLSYFPLQAERAYREAYQFSAEAAYGKQQFIGRYRFAFDAFETALRYFPWETHYAMDFVKELENYSGFTRNKEQKTIALRRAYDLLVIIQTIDPINPWYHSKKATIGRKLYTLTQNPSYQNDAHYHTHQAALTDYENPIFLMNTANLLHQQQRYSEAFYYYTKTIQIDPLFKEAYFNKADIHTKLKQHDDALACYLTVKELAPSFQNIDAIIIRASVLANAIPELDRYIATHQLANSRVLPTLETLGFFYMSQQRYLQAEPILKRIISFYTTNKQRASNTLYALYLDCLTYQKKLPERRTFIATQLALFPNDTYFLSLKKTP